MAIEIKIISKVVREETMRRSVNIYHVKRNKKGCIAPGICYQVLIVDMDFRPKQPTNSNDVSQHGVTNIPSNMLFVYNRI